MLIYNPAIIDLQSHSTQYKRERAQLLKWQLIVENANWVQESDMLAQLGPDTVERVSIYNAVGRGSSFNT